MKQIAALALLCLGLAACQTASDGSGSESQAPQWLSIIGKPLSNGSATVTLNQDGTITGSGLEGVWEERNGQYCRTLTKPAQAAGSKCQTIRVSGDQVTFVDQSGETTTWTML